MTDTHDIFTKIPPSKSKYSLIVLVNFFLSILAWQGDSSRRLRTVHIAQVIDAEAGVPRLGIDAGVLAVPPRVAHTLGGFRVG